MTTHNGAAVLLIEDGREFDAEAHLAKDQAGNWGGTLTFHDVPLIPVLLNVRDGHVLVDGNPGEFVRQDTSDWTATAGGPLTVRITGSGQAPF
ncbi:hypothetical protein [Streptomyces griseofuscus]|uniref:Uncharacterized protein n=1 Tax=Streptomyces griseofuscus TaxID=146922 RepID=A0A3R8Q6A0_9ACTN|nr:hypothetical protein [Streptomyces griseofuscus]RRQ81580.1 hypothetical protein CQW44_30740 [Streptomyces griseofuscus]